MTKIRYRFPEFHLDWKEDEFKDIFDFYQTNTFSRSQMNNRREFTRNIHYGDILTKYRNILSDLQEVPYINKDISLLKFKEESYLQNGDIIIADTAEDLTVGKAIEMQNIDGRVLSGLHTILCRPKFKFAPRFLGYNLNSSSYRRNLIPLVVGVKVCSISKTNISKTLVMYPDDINEQQKIADCLSSIDDLISAEEKKLGLLNDYKKGWMQKLFPAEGKTVPEWRFPEFQDSEEWEKLKIKKACNPPYSGGTPVTSKKEYYNGDIPFIRSGEIGKEKTELFLTSEGLDNSSAKMIEKGDVLMALYGANSGDVAISPIKGAINQAILCLRHKNNNAFLYHYLEFKKNWIVRTYIQGGQGNLSGEIVKSIELCSPQEPEEQNKIAAFLSVIDELTNSQKEKIEALKQHKKALIQGLFPSIEEVL